MSPFRCSALSPFFFSSTTYYHYTSTLLRQAPAFSVFVLLLSVGRSFVGHTKNTGDVALWAIRVLYICPRRTRSAVLDTAYVLLDRSSRCDGIARYPESHAVPEDDVCLTLPCKTLCNILCIISRQGRTEAKIRFFPPFCVQS